MTQKPYLSDQVRVVNIILNQDASLSKSQTLFAHFSYIKYVYLANQV